MSKRAPNEIESRLHQAILSGPNKRLTLQQIEAIIPESSPRQNALNFLLGVGLLRRVEGSLSFRAVTKAEFTQSKDLSEQENAILGFIKTSKDEGIWTKHLKSKTKLHQTVMQQCLQSLMAKKLIKRVPSVQHTTRKIYMLEGVKPSITLSGGPWYTDNELDREFIQHLTSACLKIIRTLSFPKRHADGTEDALYALSNAPDYPTARHIRNSLRNARLTETDLSVDDIKTLLNVLILDGEIEAIPIHGLSIWGSDDESSDEVELSSTKKRNPLMSNKGSLNPPKVKLGKAAGEDAGPSRIPSKRKQTSGVANITNTDNTDLSPSRKKAKRATQADVTDNESDEPSNRYRRQKGSKLSTVSEILEGEGARYRAIKQEQPLLGWLESPCNQCPAFEFCKAGGPVNPKNCLYYNDWMSGGRVSPAFL